ncbi:hypothetical protein AAE478_008610 [Parahypoxylon ruwenzoriense]
MVKTGQRIANTEITWVPPPPPTKASPSKALEATNSARKLQRLRSQASGVVGIFHHHKAITKSSTRDNRFNGATAKHQAQQHGYRIEVLTASILLGATVKVMNIRTIVADESRIRNHNYLTCLYVS